MIEQQLDKNMKTFMLEQKIVTLEQNKFILEHKVSNLEQTIDRLEKNNTILRTALKVYANTDSWSKQTSIHGNVTYSAKKAINQVGYTLAEDALRRA